MKTVFTNGCFDLLHAGHISLLSKARELGDRLVVGLNSDASICDLKGVERPIVNEKDRLDQLYALECVDEVYVFDSEEDLLDLIMDIMPDILVKGKDWEGNPITGANFVYQNGGKVVFIDSESDITTSKLIEELKK